MPRSPVSETPLFAPADLYSLEPSAELADKILLERWFPEEPSPDDVVPPQLGRGLKWLDGGPGWLSQGETLVKMSPFRLTATPGNLFDPDKLATYAAMFADGRIPYAHVPLVREIRMVDLDDVQESVRSREQDLLYDGFSRRYTTDDSDLDAYLADPDEYVRSNVADDDDPEEVAELIEDMQAKASQAVAEGWGDLGKPVARLHAGNHRAFAALLAGEPEIWVRVMPDP